MSESLNPKACPQCGKPISSDAPHGLCPQCVLARAATAPDLPISPQKRPHQPSIAELQAAFPSFEIIELIGAGGMGFVYKARQPKLDRFVALKILPGDASGSSAFAERFHREARVLAKLNHPNIVTVFDFGQAGEFFYLLMEFVDGVNLRDAMRAGKFSPAEALSIVPKICDALQYAHNEGVLHRDIKPENILLDTRGRVKIADFGIAKLVSEGKADVTLTASGAALGTPHYMAPEQIEKPGAVDHRADIYSLGVVFYEMLTGELPIGRFAAPSAKSTIDERVDEIVLRALAKERELRQQSAGQMKNEVETVAASAAPSSEEPAAKKSLEAHEPGHLPAALAGFTLAIVGTAAITTFPMKLFPGAIEALAHFARTSAMGVIASALVFGSILSALFAALHAIFKWGDRQSPLPRAGHELPPVPQWAIRTGALMLLVSLLALARTVWSFAASEANVVIWAWDGSVFLALTSLAFGKRSPTTRLGAILIQGAFFAVMLVLFCISGIYVLNNQIAQPNAASVRTTFFLNIIGLLAWPLSLATLLHRDVRRAFGLADLPVATASGFSRKAILGSVLVGVSLITTVPLLILIGVLVPSMQRTHTGIGTGEMLFLAALVLLAVGPGLAGTSLGISAWHDIKRSAGSLRGRPVAAFASLAWPVATVLLALIALPFLAPIVAAYRASPLSPALPSATATNDLPTLANLATNELGSQTNTVLDSPNADDDLKRRQDIQIGLAQQELRDVRIKFEVGVASQLDLAKAERDLAIAQARGDRLAVARANFKYTQLCLKSVRAQVETGKLPINELRSAEATNELARIELESAGSGQVPTPPEK